MKYIFAFLLFYSFSLAFASTDKSAFRFSFWTDSKTCNDLKGNYKVWTTSTRLADGNIIYGSNIVNLCGWELWIHGEEPVFSVTFKKKNSTQETIHLLNIPTDGFTSPVTLTSKDEVGNESNLTFGEYNHLGMTTEIE